MFSGFLEEYVSFLLALEANNNKAFFDENRGVYERVLRDPLVQLAEALYPYVWEIDPDADGRPSRVVSRINRDVRFSKDKSPYRNHMWLGFRHTGSALSEGCVFYFEISATAAHYGCGYYDMRPGTMRNLRERMVAQPSYIAGILTEERFTRLFTLKGDRFARKYTPPEGLPPPLDVLYTHKNIYAEHAFESLTPLFSAGLVEEIAEGFAVLAPFFRLLSDCLDVADAKEKR